MEHPKKFPTHLTDFWNDLLSEVSLHPPKRNDNPFRTFDRNNTEDNLFLVTNGYISDDEFFAREYPEFKQGRAVTEAEARPQ